MQETRYALGIDLGGTKIAGAVLTETGQVVVEAQSATEANQGAEHIYANLMHLVKALAKDADISAAQLLGIGVGVAGVVNSAGTVEWAPALKWKDFPLAQRLAEDFQMPVVVENDVRLQAIGEHRFGKEAGADPMVYLAIGTGLGSGIIINGKPFVGYHRAAGEVCNMVVDRSQLGRTFGGFGGLELYASGTGLTRIFAQLYPDHPALEKGITGEEICAMARNGLEEGRMVLDEFAQYVALAVVNLAATIDPELIVLGGGVSRAAHLFLPQVIKLAEPVVPAMPRLTVSELGNLAGPLGALALLDYSQAKA